MLIQFAFANYRSFAERAELDMEAMDRHSEHMDYVRESHKRKVLTVSAIHGANASGKSSVVEAFDAMRFLVLKSNYENVGRSLKHIGESFRFDPVLVGEPSEFEVTIAIESKEYQYGFRVDKTKVCAEWLREKGFSRTTTKKDWVTLFERNEQGMEASGNSKKAIEPWLEFVGAQTLALPLIAAKTSVPAYRKVYDWFSASFAIGNRCLYQKDMMRQMAIRFMAEQNIEDGVAKLLREIDPCLSNIRLVEGEGDEVELFGEHMDAGGTLVSLPFSLESEGTQRLLELLPAMLIAINTGGILFVDELEDALHILVIRMILSMFHDPESNPNNAQLVFTSHNLLTMEPEAMRRDEIWFTEKDGMGRSTLYSLADFKVRSDLDYVRSYRAGRFGAIPFVREMDA